MERSLMRFHAKYVSATEAGDYYQVSFETEDPGDDATDPPGLDSPYLIIQRQFETPDGGRCYVETHDHGYVGHYRLKLIDFNPTQLGPVDKPDPETNASEQDEAEEAGCGLVIAGGNTPLFLEMTNEALDA